jgi:DnaJ-domain-containing protein 1
MSLKDRFVDGVSSLFDKLNDGDGVTGVDPAGLERELAKRVAARKAAGNPPAHDNARARLAGAGSKAREEREALAQKRVAKIHGERKRRAATKQKEQDEAFRNMADEARRAPPPPRPGYSSQTPPRTGPHSSSQSRSRSRMPGAGMFGNKELAQHYKTLGISPDADASELKSAYRQLMRKYHPDLHQDERKKKAATELATKISTAYAAIEKSRK